MGAGYLSLTVELPEPQAEVLEDLLHDSGALGLEVRDSEAPPMPGVRGPQKGEAIVIAFYDSNDTATSARDEVLGRFPAARLSLEAVVERDWSNEWKALIRSVEVGPLWVGPPWDAAQAPAGKQRIVIEPKMAFGTGDHPTTLLCLEAVADVVPAQPGLSVLDVGTGTGVLAIAAKRLGAGRVVGVDNDAMSVELANENAQVNGVFDLALSGKSLSQIDGRFDLVLANILANTLVELAPAIAAKASSRLFLSGVLRHQQDEVVAAYLAQGLALDGVRHNGDWIRIDLARR